MPKTPPDNEGMDPLDQPRFAFQATGQGRVRISFLGKTITTLAGKAAAQFLLRAEGLSARETQRLMARATGHFKHGNERQGAGKG